MQELSSLLKQIRIFASGCKNIKGPYRYTVRLFFFLTRAVTYNELKCENVPESYTQEKVHTDKEFA